MSICQMVRTLKILGTAIILYNGLYFPVRLMNRSVSWAASNGFHLTALFMLSDKKKADDEDGTEKYLAIVQEQIVLLKNTAKAAGVALNTKILSNVTVKSLHAPLKLADYLFTALLPGKIPLRCIDPFIIARAFTATGTIYEQVD